MIRLRDWSQCHEVVKLDFRDNLELVTLIFLDGLKCYVSFTFPHAYILNTQEYT